jgi:hypothetical protein
VKSRRETSVHTKRTAVMNNASDSCEYTYTSTGRLSSVSTSKSKYELAYDESGLVNKHVKVAIEESKIEQGVKIGFWIGVAVAGVLIAATLAEDVVTAGAGIADDAASVGVASGAFRTAVSFGIAFV